MNDNDITIGMRVKTSVLAPYHNRTFTPAITLLKSSDPAEDLHVTLMAERGEGLSGTVKQRLPGDDHEVFLVQHVTGKMAVYRSSELERHVGQKVTFKVTDEVAAKIMAKKEHILESAKALGIPILDISFEYTPDAP